MSKVVIEVRETGPHTFTAVACDGRYAACGTDKKDLIDSLSRQLPPELREEKPEVRFIPLPVPGETPFWSY
jgi:hypothetical protein